MFKQVRRKYLSHNTSSKDEIRAGSLEIIRLQQETSENKILNKTDLYLFNI